MILNGLGRTKYEELFVVWGTVARAAARARLYASCEPEVGELVTSLDMAGCSLTVMWLDDELERYWTRTGRHPGLSQGRHARRDERRGAHRRGAEAAAATPALAELSDDDGRIGGQTCRPGTSTRWPAMLADAEDELGRIDAVAGDGDHGRGMVKGSTARADAAHAPLAEGAGTGSVLTAAGEAWAAKAGGTSGVLWGACSAPLRRAPRRHRHARFGRPSPRRCATATTR